MPISSDVLKKGTSIEILSRNISLTSDNIRFFDNELMSSLHMKTFIELKTRMHQNVKRGYALSI